MCALLFTELLIHKSHQINSNTYHLHIIYITERKGLFQVNESNVPVIQKQETIFRVEMCIFSQIQKGLCQQCRDSKEKDTRHKKCMIFGDQDRTHTHSKEIKCATMIRMAPSSLLYHNIIVWTVGIVSWKARGRLKKSDREREREGTQIERTATISLVFESQPKYAVSV